MRFHRLIAALFLSFFSARAPAAPPHPDGPQTQYTILFEAAEAQWPPAWFSYDEAKDGDFRMTCYVHPDRPFYMGVEVTQTIHEALGSVESILDGVEKYRELFAGFDEIKKTETIPNGWAVFWHRPIPVPFVPDLRYETVYFNRKVSPQRKTYRYQMKQKIDLLKSVDGLIVLDGVAPKKTRITQFTFWDGKYGPMETFSPKGVWKDNVRDVYHSNLGIKLRAENPGWDAPTLKSEVKKIIDEKRIESCIEGKKTLPGITGKEKT